MRVQWTMQEDLAWSSVRVFLRRTASVMSRVHRRVRQCKGLKGDEFRYFLRAES